MTRKGHQARAGLNLVISGVAWTTAYRAFASIAQFGSMLILVRIIPPLEYGRAGAVAGILAFLNVVSCSVFVTEAMQHRENIKPDWSLHWRAGWRIQTGLFVIVNGIAAFFWLVPEYRPIAALTHLASLGLLLECPSSLRTTMLRRTMNFRRLRILDGMAKLLSIAAILSMGVAGLGAAAIVIGANVIPAIPATVDLLVVGRWRPEGGFWRRPDWGAYLPSLRFGAQRSWSAVMQAGRVGIEAAVFPLSLGFGALGLFQRAQALFSSTVGHLNSIFQETTYPFLPTRAHDDGAYRPMATIFLQVVTFVGVTGAAFVAVEGAHLSRLLYGEKWMAADALIAPASLLGFGFCLFGGSYAVLLARSRLRACFVLDAANACLTIPVILFVLAGRSLEMYAWFLGAGQTLAGVAALSAASSTLSHRWQRTVLAPPLFSAPIAAAVVLACERNVSVQLFHHFLLSACLYATVLAVVMRLFFPEALVIVLGRLPLGTRMVRLLRLRISN